MNELGRGVRSWGLAKNFSPPLPLLVGVAVWAVASWGRCGCKWFFGKVLFVIAYFQDNALLSLCRPSFIFGGGVAGVLVAVVVGGGSDCLAVAKTRGRRGVVVAVSVASWGVICYHNRPKIIKYSKLGENGENGKVKNINHLASLIL